MIFTQEKYNYDLESYIYENIKRLHNKDIESCDDVIGSLI
jgi:hypothetical protein